MHILLTRPLDDCSEMILKFKSLGLQVYHLQLLKIDKMNFKHFMLKEIYDQPETAKNWLENYLIKSPENGQYQINYPFDSFLPIP